MSGPPLVTVLVPTHHEGADIEGCLSAIAAQDHPANRLEVIVVDGLSTDGTADLARSVLSRWDFESTAVLSNDGKTASSNLNLGLRHASGEIICRVDARTRIEPHYVRTCVKVLTTRPEVAVVGGAQEAIARDATARSHGIARALNNRWSMGGSRYRRATSSGASDTVYLGAFRRADLLQVGGWDERFVSNQDFDLNQRMAQRGVVWFEASLRSGYLPRPTLSDLWRQYSRFGKAKVHYWWTKGEKPRPRQAALLGAPPLALLAAGGLIAVSPAPRARFMEVVAVGLLTLVAVEVFGASRPRSGLTAHGWAAAAILVVGGSWWTGVASGVRALRGRPEALAVRGSDEPANEVRPDV